MDPPPPVRFDEDETEASRRHLDLEVRMFADRLIGSSGWLLQNERTPALGIAYFGASTGAAAVLLAAARTPYPLEAVVSRGGRPDLAADQPSRVRAPTLLIVGGDDEAVIERNREALEALGCEKELRIVRRATHFFEEPGALDAVAHLATAWYGHHLVGSGPWRTDDA